MVFDNVFSGLDSTTTNRIFEKVFSPGGLKDILGITVIIVSHSGKLLVLPYHQWYVGWLWWWIVRHIQAADSVIVIEDGLPVHCDTFDELQKGSNRYIAQLLDHAKQPCTAEPSSDLEPVKKPIRPPMDHIIRRNKEVDATRQSGDTAVYAYYLRAVGWRDSIFLLILGAVSVFCDKFPSRSLIYNQ